MSKLLFVLCLFSVSVAGQQVLPVAGMISLGLNVNLTELEPEIQVYQDQFESLTFGLSIEEAAENFPYIFNLTTYAVPDPYVIAFNGGAPIIEAIIRSENGTEIVREVFKNPDILLEVFTVQASNWDPATVERDSTLIITNYILTITVPFLNERFRDFTRELLVSSTLAAIEELEGVDVVGNIQILIDNLDQAVSSEGDLAGFLQDDVVQQAVETTLLQAGVDTDVPVLADLVAQFLEEVETSVDMDSTELLQFFKQVFESRQGCAR
eukprot:TRINITY_DN1015_c2_g1_i3.p1 TRINITY_DN1015_c2_g1~~TRINITY_DN1015_c2_g1_i3.p1  ORF type:complete len:267 (-),score=46.50 TRINITY_DN1015_c2_g1_i3:56-856(-)